MIRFVALTPELLALLPLAPGFDVPDDCAEQLARCAAPGVSLAMIEGGRVLGAGGVVQVWRGRGYAWLLPGAWMEARHYGWALARCRLELARLQTAGMWRIECAVQCGFPERVRWVDRLGFACEGVMQQFGPDGSDHELWARLPPTHAERRSLIERVAA